MDGQQGITPAPSSPSGKRAASGELERPVKRPANSPGRASASAESAAAPPAAAAAEPAEELPVTFDVITNDGTPEHNRQLITLKNIFSRQLPKMPKDYIVRLVLDRRHKSLCIKRGDKVIGGICFRPFRSQGFAEIAFCAITASEQVKGFGTRLMSQLKEVVKPEGVTHFLTFADNYAIGYFRKQGFTKSVSMDNSRWVGYIKEYDGGTLMECVIDDRIDYAALPDMLEKQRAFVMRLVQARGQSHVLRPGLAGFEAGDVFALPGFAEGGWTPSATSRHSERETAALQGQLLQIVKTIGAHDAAWPFAQPVDLSVVPDYTTIIADPLDLQTVTERLAEGRYYRTWQMLAADIARICENAKLYNDATSSYYQAACSLQEFAKAQFARFEES